MGWSRTWALSAEKICKGTFDKDSEGPAAKKSKAGGDRGWKKGLHSVQTVSDLIVSGYGEGAGREHERRKKTLMEE